MYAITSPLPVFYDTNGDVLDGGYIYIGEPSLNPVTSPKPVYWDEEGTQPAPQPLRTIDGMIARAGTPARLYVDGDYSILVQDKRGRQVFYARNSADYQTALLGPGGSALVGFQQAGTGAATRTVQAKGRERVSILDYYTGSNTYEDALNKAIAYLQTVGGGDIHWGAVTVELPAQAVWDALENIRFIGSGPEVSILRQTGTSSLNLLYLKAPRNVQFIDIGFESINHETAFHGFWVTAYEAIKFIRCSFTKFGSLTGTKAGFCILTLTSTDTASALDAAGDSTDGRVIDCFFDGDERGANFGVRIITDFTSPPTTTLTDTHVEGSTFVGFNWNAVELAGQQTSACSVTDSTALRCGLAPFEIDKGASNCTVQGVVINRLLGNKDSNTLNSPARIAAVSVQGVDASGGYARGNLVSDVTVHLLADDLEAFNGQYAQGAVVVNLAYAIGNRIENIVARCDRTPARVRQTSLAIVYATTAVGNIVQDITTTKSAEGVIFNGHTEAMGSDWNEFRRIRNIASILTGEVIVCRFIADQCRNYFEGIVCLSDMTVPYVSANTYLAYVTGTDVNTATIVENCAIGSYNDVNGWFWNAPRLSLHEVNVDIPTQSKWMAVGATCVQLDFGSNQWKGGPVDVAVLASGAWAAGGFPTVYQNRVGMYVTNNHPAGNDPSIEWRSSIAPTNSANIALTAKSRKQAATAGGYAAWIRCTGPVWKECEAIAA